MGEREALVLLHNLAETGRGEIRMAGQVAFAEAFGKISPVVLKERKLHDLNFGQSQIFDGKYFHEKMQVQYYNMSEKETYIDLLKKVLLDYHRTGMEYKSLQTYNRHWKNRLLMIVDKYLRRKGFAVVRQNPYAFADNRLRKFGPASAETMIGVARMNNIEYCIREIAKNNIEGDLIECGVWRGGAVIFMKALVKELGLKKIVWAADSFQGLPEPQSELEKNDHHYIFDEMVVPLETVKENFRKYGLLDDGVKFLVGWFKDTLPTAPIKKLALLRADGDMYSSTTDILVNLYPKLSKGGFCIIDDYGQIPNCKRAVDDYRRENLITDDIINIDGEGVYWRKS